MKKCFCLFLLSIFAIVSLGQIKKNVGGIILGKTKKQEVINYLKSKKIPYSFGQVGAYNAIICNKGRTFGGVTWSSTIYTLYKNTVFRISYSNSDYDMSKEDLDLCFQSLSIALQRKYYRYKTIDSNRDNMNFKDSNVDITLNRGYFDNHYLLSIYYTDINLLEKAFSDADNEL